MECADRSVTRTIGELVELAAHQAHDLEIGAELASQTLGRQGLRLEQGLLLVSNTAQPIAQILREAAHGNFYVLGQTLWSKPGAATASRFYSREQCLAAWAAAWSRYCLSQRPF